MVRLLAFLLLLVPSLALAQAEFSTIISPTTFPTSPTGTTIVSPTGTIPVNVQNTVTTIPTGTLAVTVVNSPSVNILGTPTVSVPGVSLVGTSSTYFYVTQFNSTTAPFTVQQSGAITITGTVSTSPTGSTPITGNVGVTGTVSTSPTVNTPVNIIQVNSNAISNAVPVSAFISNVPAVTVNGTVTTSGNTPVAISGTAAVSSSAATWPVSPTVNTPVTEATSPWQVNVGNSLTVGGTVTVSTSSAPQPVTQSTQTSPWQVNVGNTVTVSTASQTVTASQSQIVPTSEKGMGYLDRLNFVAGSAVTTNSTLLVLVKAPVSPSKLFITSAQCSRTDSPVGSVLFVALNNLLTTGVSTYLQVPAAGVTVTFPTPLVISPTTSLFMQASTNVTSVYCNAQGYQAP